MVNWKEVVKSSVGIIKEFIDRGVTPTVRTVYYALVSKGLIPNTLTAYKGLSKALVGARKDRVISWSSIADETRQARGGDDVLWEPDEYAKAYVDYLFKKISEFTLPKWLNQKHYIEVWLEKFALAATFDNFLEGVNVTLVPSRGYSSWTFLKDAAVRINGAIKDTGKTPVILYFGDFDPSGADIERFLQESMYWFGIDVKVKRIGVTKEQIEEYNLPNAPEDASEIEKLQRDPRFKSWPWGLYRVELDALLAFVPDEFKRIVQEAVNGYFDEDIYNEVLERQAEQRKQVEETALGLIDEKRNEDGEDREGVSYNNPDTEGP